MAPTINQVLAVAAGQIGKYFPGLSPYGSWYDDKLDTKAPPGSCSEHPTTRAGEVRRFTSL